VIRGIPGLEAAQVLAEGEERAGLRVIVFMVEGKSIKHGAERSEGKRV
jgi:hypothetical protein